MTNIDEHVKRGKTVAQMVATGRLSGGIVYHHSRSAKRDVNAQMTSLRVVLSAPCIPRPDINSRLGNVMWSMRQLRGLTQYQLAEMSGVSQSMLSLLESGQRNSSINLNAMYRIAACLNWRLSDMIRMAEDVPSTEGVIRETEQLIRDIEQGESPKFS